MAQPACGERELIESTCCQKFCSLFEGAGDLGVINPFVLNPFVLKYHPGRICYFVAHDSSSRHQIPKKYILHRQSTLIV